jgi:putative YhdH/YhfP family quinone oxidoreductase
MTDTTFKALWVTETPQKTFERTLIDRPLQDLPAGEVLIKVAYSSLNYKDALSATGNKGVTKKYPHTPGVDAAGIVAESHHPQFQAGEAVIVTGYDLGMNTAGAFAEYIRVPATWVVKLPNHLTLKDSMIYGTAGFTAAQSILQLQHAGLRPDQGEVLVTGATGGVGSLGVALLANLGYHVVAATGKPQSHDFLRTLGAKEIIDRDTLRDDPHRPLLKSRWAGVLDTVGGDILAAAIKSTQYRGRVSCCGLVASPQLSLTVFPFILRGVHLLGIDSAQCPEEIRLKIWELLAGDWNIASLLPKLVIDSDLVKLNTVYIDQILQGQVQGRVVITL